MNVDWIREMVQFVLKKKTIKWSTPSKGTTWCEKCNVLPTFYSSNNNMSVTVESLIQKRTTVAGSNIKKNTLSKLGEGGNLD